MYGLGLTYHSGELDGKQHGNETGTEVLHIIGVLQRVENLNLKLPHCQNLSMCFIHNLVTP